MVFEDDDVAAFRQFEQLFAPIQGHAHAGGQLEGRDGVDHLGADSVGFELIRRRDSISSTTMPSSSTGTPRMVPPAASM